MSAETRVQPLTLPLLLVILTIPLVLFVHSVDAGTAAQIRSTTTNLFHDNLNGTDNSNYPSFLLLDTPLSYATAGISCETLGESLLTISSAQVRQNNIASELSYALHRDGGSSTQQFWLLDGIVTVSVKNRSVQYSEMPSKNILLPAICTQSPSGATKDTSLAPTTNQVNVTSASNGNMYVGFRNHKSYRFLGIPYANKPARWTHSSVSTTQNSVVNATAFGNSCNQASSINGVEIMNSEDCLFLNVFVPSSSPCSNASSSKQLPVIVFVYGGSFTEGSGDIPTYGEANVTQVCVVLVTANYRVGEAGLLAIPERNITENYGLGDQITALQWVKENIQTFGGDPSRVTITSQNADAEVIQAILASPKAHGLFSTAISSPASSLYTMNTDELISYYGYTPTGSSA